LSKTLPRFLTTKQTLAILAHTEFYNWRYVSERYRNTAIINTFLFTGIRLNELRHLEIIDVNLNDGEIIVRKGKGRKERMVPIHPKLYPILKNYLNYREKEKYKSIWFFQSLRAGTKVSAKTIQHICRKVSIASEVKFTSHMLRHTYARNCINSGVGLYQTKEMLGHASVATTEIYLSISKQNLKKTFCNATMI
jgi:site-specific recombinase XerD